jgi:hypothetical protein
LTLTPELVVEYATQATGIKFGGFQSAKNANHFVDGLFASNQMVVCAQLLLLLLVIGFLESKATFFKGVYKRVEIFEPPTFSTSACSSLRAHFI